jgi:hypothetical protein
MAARIVALANTERSFVIPLSLPSAHRLAAKLAGTLHR